ncbi:MAG: winged helix-turn-helix domain-containing protein, partial [Methyloceanibacter sp.]
RRYGYYVLPFLFGERLAARVDLRADRKIGRLKVEGAFAEPKVDPVRLIPALAGELLLLAEWLGLEQLKCGRRGDLIAPLKRALAIPGA